MRLRELDASLQNVPCETEQRRKWFGRDREELMEKWGFMNGGGRGQAGDRPAGNTLCVLGRSESPHHSRCREHPGESTCTEGTARQGALDGRPQQPRRQGRVFAFLSEQIGLSGADAVRMSGDALPPGGGPPTRWLPLGPAVPGCRAPAWLRGRGGPGPPRALPAAAGGGDRSA